MEYINVQARFLFNGKKDKFTVEYSYGLRKWFIFKNEDTTKAIHIKEDKIDAKNVNFENALKILNDYLK